jgi:hypothetical protein
MSGENDGTERASSRLDRFGDRRHELTSADSRKGAVARWAAERERRAELERQAVEKLADELLDALDTYLEVMDNRVRGRGCGLPRRGGSCGLDERRNWPYHETAPVSPTGVTTLGGAGSALDHRTDARSRRGQRRTTRRCGKREATPGVSPVISAPGAVSPSSSKRRRSSSCRLEGSGRGGRM